MNSSHRLHSDLSRLSRETDMFLATVDSFAEDELTAPSLCEGWTRAHVIAHLASSATAFVKLIDRAVTGEETPLYASPEAREEEINALAALPREELVAKAHESADLFAEQAQRLDGDLAVEEVDIHGKKLPVSGIVPARIAEIVVHHGDLDTAWSIEEADPDSVLDALEAAVRTMRFKNAPDMTLVTEERDEWVIGSGGQKIFSDREGLLEWLARGNEEHVESSAPLPELPSW